MLFKIKLIGLLAVMMLFSAGVFAEDWSNKSYSEVRAGAEQGNAEAQFRLGVMYRTGTGVAQNDTEAARWHRLAAEQGSADAQYFLGLMYSNGTGVAQNYAQAYVWFNVSAAQGDEQSHEGRDRSGQQLSPSLLNKAQQQSQRCIDSSYKDCDL